MRSAVAARKIRKRNAVRLHWSADWLLMIILLIVGWDTMGMWLINVNHSDTSWKIVQKRKRITRPTMGK